MSTCSDGIPESICWFNEQAKQGEDALKAATQSILTLNKGSKPIGVEAAPALSLGQTAQWGTFTSWMSWLGLSNQWLEYFGISAEPQKIKLGGTNDFPTVAQGVVQMAALNAQNNDKNQGHLQALQQSINDYAIDDTKKQLLEAVLRKKAQPGLEANAAVAPDQFNANFLTGNFLLGANEKTTASDVNNIGSMFAPAANFATTNCVVSSSSSTPVTGATIGEFATGTVPAGADILLSAITAVSTTGEAAADGKPCMTVTGEQLVAMFKALKAGTGITVGSKYSDSTAAVATALATTAETSIKGTELDAAAYAKLPAEQKNFFTLFAQFDGDDSTCAVSKDKKTCKFEVMNDTTMADIVNANAKGQLAVDSTPAIKAKVPTQIEASLNNKILAFVVANFESKDLTFSSGGIPKCTARAGTDKAKTCNANLNKMADAYCNLDAEARYVCIRKIGNFIDKVMWVKGTGSGDLAVPQCAKGGTSGDPCAQGLSTSQYLDLGTIQKYMDPLVTECSIGNTDGFDC